MSLQGQNVTIERPRGLEEVTTDWRKARVVPVLENSSKGNCWLISLASVPVETLVLLEHISWRRKEEMTGEDGMCLPSLTDPIAFCNKTTGFVGEGRAVDIIYLEFCKTFDSSYHSLIQIRTLWSQWWKATWVKKH